MPEHHILLAEDEEHLRYTLSLLLKKMGFIVTVTSNGSEALEIIRDHKDKSIPVDFLVVDQQIPGLTGLQLIEKLESENLFLPSLLITGFADEMVLAEIKKRKNIGYLPKPFNPKELAKHILRLYGLFTER